MKSNRMKSTHTHRDEQGLLVKCYHHCKGWLSPGFLAGFLIVNTITFGPEHLLWEKVWPFYAFTHWMEGLHHAPAWLSAVVLVGWFLFIFVGIRWVVRSKSS